MKFSGIKLHNFFSKFLSPVSSNPLQEKKFFKIFWAVTTFLGLLPFKLTRWQQFRAFMVFLTFCVPANFLLFYTVFVSENIDDKVHGIQTIPVLFLIIVDASNFMQKSRKIEEFCEKFDRVMTRQSDKNFCRTKFYVTNLYFVISVLFLTCSIVSNMLVFALTGESGIPILKFGGNFGLILTMTAQFMMMIYTGAIFLFLDTFMCSLLFLISGYSEHLSEKFKVMKIDNIREIVDLHLELKNMLSSYEEIFSTVIMLRGLLNVFALSSIVLEIVDKGSSGMTFNVLFFGFNGLFKLFTPCYYGSCIEHESEKNFRHIYDIPWLRGELFEKKELLVVQQNFLKNLRVKAVRIVDINLETFVKILQWTYSMYAAMWVLKN